MVNLVILPVNVECVVGPEDAEAAVHPDFVAVQAMGEGVTVLMAGPLGAVVLSPRGRSYSKSPPYLWKHGLEKKKTMTTGSSGRHCCECIKKKLKPRHKASCMGVWKCRSDVTKDAMQTCFNSLHECLRDPKITR